MSLFATETSIVDPWNGATTEAVGSITVNEPLPATLCSAVSLHAAAGNETSILPSGKTPLR